MGFTRDKVSNEFCLASLDGLADEKGSQDFGADHALFTIQSSLDMSQWCTMIL